MREELGCCFPADERVLSLNAPPAKVLPALPLCSDTLTHARIDLELPLSDSVLKHKPMKQ